MVKDMTVSGKSEDILFFFIVLNQYVRLVIHCLKMN